MVVGPLASWLPAQTRLGFPIEGCDETDFETLRGVVESTLQAAEASMSGSTWQWARGAAPTLGNARLQHNVDCIVEALASLTGDGYGDSQSLTCRASEELRGVGLLSSSSGNSLCAAASGAVAGDLVGILTCLRGRQYRLGLSASAAARMQSFSEPVWPKTGAAGPVFDRWLHVGLRWLGRPRSDGNVCIAPVVAITSCHDGFHAPRSVWLFAVAYVCMDVPAGVAFRIARDPEASSCQGAAQPSDEVDPKDDDSPSTDDEAQRADGDGEIAPVIDLYESQIMPHCDYQDNEENKKQGSVQEPEQQPQDVFVQCPAEIVATDSKLTRLRSTWASVIHELPTPVDWATNVNRVCGPDLRSAIDNINGASRPLRIGTPCAGFEAPIFALRGLGIKNFERTFAVDIAPRAANFGRALSRALKYESPCHWLGPSEGDLLARPLHEYPTVDLLIAGPPCPPWSRYGRRQGRDDARALVFWRVIDLVAHLALRDTEGNACVGDDTSLKVFVLENVEGILQHDAHHRRGIDEVLSRLESNVPSFNISVLRMNSRNYSLPQNRPRVYVVGVRKDCLRPGSIIDVPPKHLRTTFFKEWLAEWDVTPKQFHSFPDRLISKKRKWDQHLDDKDVQARTRGKPLWQAANANLERDRGNKYSCSARVDGLFGTITTQDRLWLWLRHVPTDYTDLAAVAPAAHAKQRYLMPVEALAMQGFPTKDPVLVTALEGLNDSEILFGAGNAMSVPVVAAIFAEIFQKTTISDLIPLRSGRALDEQACCSEEAAPKQSVSIVNPTCEDLVAKSAISDADDHVDATNAVGMISAMTVDSRHVITVDDSVEIERPRSEALLVCQSGLRVATPQLASSVPTDSEIAPILEPVRFQTCGCWMHLVHVPFGKNSQGIIHAREARLLIGRDPAQVPSDGRIVEPFDNEHISRRHAELHVGANGAAPRVVDLESKNGTLVLGRGPAPTEAPGMPLYHGDLIAFGPGPAVPDVNFKLLYRVVFPVK